MESGEGRVPPLVPPYAKLLAWRTFCQFLGILAYKSAAYQVPQPGGAVDYPAQPRLIRLSPESSVSHITFNYSAENCPGPTDLVKYSLKIVD